MKTYLQYLSLQTKQWIDFDFYFYDDVLDYSKISLNKFKKLQYKQEMDSQ